MKMNNTSPNTENKGRTEETETTLDTRHRQHWAQDTDNIGHKTQTTVGTIKTTLGTRNIQHWAQDTYNIGHKKHTTLDTRHRQHWTQDTDNIGHKTQTILDTRHKQHWTQDTNNIGHKTQNKDKQNKNTTQKTKRIRIPQKTGGELMCSGKVSSSCF